MKTNHTNSLRSPFKVFYFCLVLTITDMHLQILVKIPNVKFSDNPSAVSLLRTDRKETDMTRLICDFVYGFAYLLTPWSRVLLEKLISSQLVKKFPSFYGTPRFNPAFKSARHLSLS
jgi:hypothetical protein